MPHFAKPYFLKCRGIWKVQIKGKQVNLGPDKEEAFRKYHELMATKVVIHAGSVIGIIDKYLEWCQEHRAPDTYEWYRWRLQLFCKTIPVSLSVGQLRYFHIHEWLKGRPDWSSGTKHGMARAVIRAMRWAKKKGYIDFNPISDYEKSRPGRRTVVILPAAFSDLLDNAGCQEFRDLLVFTWETAARPQESLIAEARHLDLQNSRMCFAPEESKGDEWTRSIYPNDASVEIVTRLAGMYPQGPLFRNSEGIPWTTDAVNCAFQRIRIRPANAP